MEQFDVLDSAEKIEAIDKSGMLGIVAKTPAMLAEALEIASKVPLGKVKKIKNIVVCGMGGSAIAGNIVANLLQEKCALAVFVNRDYRLPAFVGADALIFAMSYSGNTEETLLAVKEAGKRGAKIICVTSGGKLKEIAESKKYPLYLIPAGYQPRAALPYLLVPILVALEKSGLISNLRADINSAILLTQSLCLEYGADKPSRINPVKQFAKKLLGKNPIIFANTGITEAVGLRVKTQFNENGKVTALLNFFPELNHNEIVNLSLLKRTDHKFVLIFLRDENDSERIKKRMEITKSLIGRQLGGTNELWAQGQSHLARIMSLICFGDYLSCYMAILHGVDPTPVDVITKLKRELAR
ncbi:bifunctional phosphoglucose/phosphomannose isomerase [candidate division WOR-1 bacterium RIFCSPHIGHO2_02_FULL_45_12]|nr:MAG: bifunctional phosphoglucose/phosphomannose isomerase [candidate division WOR-1 bacterium RIFCSPHIGHO2_02_FULL_45_12]